LVKLLPNDRVLGHFPLFFKSFPTLSGIRSLLDFRAKKVALALRLTASHGRAAIEGTPTRLLQPLRGDSMPLVLLKKKRPQMVGPQVKKGLSRERWATIRYYD
jgi:hypothetical protein